MLTGRRVALVGSAATTSMGTDLGRGLHDAHGAEIVSIHADDVDGVVVVPFGAATTGAFVDVDDNQWDARCEAIMRDGLVGVQSGWNALHARGGAVVVISAAEGLVGAAERAPETAAAEGLRALVKSAARQWAERNVTVNVVAVPLDHHVESAAVNATAFLLSAHAAGITGNTITADGGVVMLP